MRVLGIAAFYHDSAAALVEDGFILQQRNKTVCVFYFTTAPAGGDRDFGHWWDRDSSQPAHPLGTTRDRLLVLL